MPYFTFTVNSRCFSTTVAMKEGGLKIHVSSYVKATIRSKKVNYAEESKKDRTTYNAGAETQALQLRISSSANVINSLFDRAMKLI